MPSESQQSAFVGATPKGVQQMLPSQPSPGAQSAGLVHAAPAVLTHAEETPFAGPQWREQHSPAPIRCVQSVPSRAHLHDPFSHAPEQHSASVEHAADTAAQVHTPD
jgi:hypothetical protein